MVLKPRAEAPRWINKENPAKSAKCLRFPPHREDDGVLKDPWFEGDELSAAAICNGDWDDQMCPIRNECLHWALLNNEKFGVWGGMLPHDRLNMRQAKREDPYMEWMWHPPTPKDPDNDEPWSLEVSLVETLN
ncbi:WhiB family transcriptional regulator [Nonomuraea jabiensis]|uniref:WhiB family transcriptional regulator n=1 Tax=Nonomuraea jabiensis TaxID=882448 RepID=UPI0034416FD7